MIEFNQGKKDVLAMLELVEKGSAQMSNARIARLVLNLEEAKKALPSQQYKQYKQIYKDYQAKDNLHTFDLDNCLNVAREIIQKYKEIGCKNYQGYYVLGYALYVDDLTKGQIEPLKNPVDVDISEYKFAIQHRMSMNKGITYQDAIDYFRFWNVLKNVFDQHEILRHFHCFVMEMVNKQGPEHTFLVLGTFIDDLQWTNLYSIDEEKNILLNRYTKMLQAMASKDKESYNQHSRKL